MEQSELQTSHNARVRYDESDPGHPGRALHPMFESRKRNIQKRHGFGEQAFPLEHSVSPEPSSLERAQTVHGYLGSKSDDTYWEERSRHNGRDLHLCENWNSQIDNLYIYDSENREIPSTGAGNESVEHDSSPIYIQGH